MASVASRSASPAWTLPCGSSWCRASRAACSASVVRPILARASTQSRYASARRGPGVREVGEPVDAAVAFGRLGQSAGEPARRNATRPDGSRAVPRSGRAAPGRGRAAAHAGWHRARPGWGHRRGSRARRRPPARSRGWPPARSPRSSAGNGPWPRRDRSDQLLRSVRAGETTLGVVTTDGLQQHPVGPRASVREERRARPVEQVAHLDRPALSSPNVRYSP